MNAYHEIFITHQPLILLLHPEKGDELRVQSKLKFRDYSVERWFLKKQQMLAPAMSLATTDVI